MNQMRVAILGGGRLAVRLAQLLGRTPLSIRAWARSPTARTELASVCGKNTTVVDAMADAARDADVMVLCVPALAVAPLATALGEFCTADQVLLHACRGVGPGFLLPHRAVRTSCCIRKVGVLGGPLYFGDVARGRPLVAMLASRFDETFAATRRLVEGTPVRLHFTHDVVGVEVAGAISNVTALAVGMAEELALGDTARGVLATRGLTEAARVGRALGADPETFGGLAGVGDLIPREVTSQRRHRELGALLAGKTALEQAMGQVSGAVEGVATARELVALADHHQLKLPLMTAVAAVLDGQQDAAAALEGVLGLDIELEPLHASL